MNDAIDGKSKVRRAVTAVAGATVSEVLGNALTSGSPAAAPAAEQVHPVAAETTGHEWVPETETSSVTRGEDGSVEAKTGTIWRPETHGGTEAPPADLPTIEEFEQIDVHEDAFGNFVIDATERVVVHNHGHDETYVDHQHLVIPGDGTPGDTDLDIIEREDVVVHENPDGTISVEHHGSLIVETHPDAPGHGDIEVWQEESVTLDEAPTGPKGIEVGITEDEQARAEDPFGEPAGPTIYQTETVGDKSRTVVSTATAPSPSISAPPSSAAVTYARQPSTVDPAPAAAAESSTLAASNSLADHPAVRHVDPKPAFAAEHPAKHSFATDPAAGKHDPGELSGPKPAPEEHPLDVPKGEETPPGDLPATHHLGDPPEPPEPPVPESADPDFPGHEQHSPFESHAVPEHHSTFDEPQEAPEVPAPEPFHQAHADGGG